MALPNPWISRVNETTPTISMQWVDDVKQEIVVRLADKLRRVPDMHLDRRRAAHQLGGWVYTILLRDCQQAIRTLRRVHYRNVRLFDSYVINDRTSRIDAQLDFEDALRKLDDPELTVIVLYRHVVSASAATSRLPLHFR